MRNLYKIEDELYIISDKEKSSYCIKECPMAGLNIDRCDCPIQGGCSNKVGNVILTTNNLLIKDGVQAIDDEFLQWFVKNPSCEEVDTRRVANGVANHKLTYEYKIIIPKEIDVLELGQIIPKEEPKQERIFDYNKKLESDCDDENFASGKIILQWNKEDQKQDTPLRICRMSLDLQYGNTAILRLEEIEELIKNLQIVRDRLL